MAVKKDKAVQTLEGYIENEYKKAKDKMDKQCQKAKQKVDRANNDKEKTKAEQEYAKCIEQRKEMTINKWFTDLVNIISKYFKRASYIGKYTHPDSTISVYQSCGTAEEGYVLTEGNQCDFDIYMGNGNRIPAANFLLFPIVLNESVLEDILHHGGRTKAVLEKMGLDYLLLESAIQVMEDKSNPIPSYTESQLRQVYFPVGPDQYHLLTILPASSLMWKCTSIIQRFRARAFAVRDKKDPEYGGDWEEIKNLTMVGFGGTKPQNISALNSRRGGKAYLLPSLPPVWLQRSVRKPKRNFFYNTINKWSFQSDIFALHTLMQQGRNTVKIRENIVNIVMHMADNVLAQGDILREEPEGWTDEVLYENLPLPQKIWLDEKYKELRKDTDWIIAVSEDFARWLIRTYDRFLGHEAYMLGDSEFAFFKDIMVKALKEEVRGE